MRRWFLALAGLGLSAAVGLRAAQLLDAVAASNAKVLCSAVFVSGRDLAEARAHSLRVAPPAAGCASIVPILVSPCRSRA